MKNLGYYNGKLGLIEEMEIPMTDRAFYFGDGVYDAVMCRNNIPYLLEEHLDRFYSNCDKLEICVPMSKNEFSGLICELAKMVDAVEKFIYFHASRGSALRSHSLMPTKANMCVMITPQKMGEIGDKMNAILMPDIRYRLCNMKTLNLLPNVLAAQMAEKKGADEAIFHREGNVTEGTHCNVSVILNGEIVTAPADCNILPGVTRSHLIKKAQKLGISVIERSYSIKEMMMAEEILITSSSKMLRGVGKLDGITIGGKNPSILKALQDELLSDYLKATSTIA